MDPRTEVRPEELLPHRYHRKPPYIYTDEEIENLPRAAQQLPSSRGLRAVTYSTFFSLLAVTGMRVSEAVALDRNDVELEEGILTLRRTKFGKSRLVPVHASTGHALKSYSEHRDRIVLMSTTEGFFISERGTRITHWSARYTFAKVSQQIGLRASATGHGRGPNPLSIAGEQNRDAAYHYRHTAAMHLLRAGSDINMVGQWLGHADVNTTHLYVQIDMAMKRRMLEKAGVPSVEQPHTCRIFEAGAPFCTRRIRG